MARSYAVVLNGESAPQRHRPRGVKVCAFRGGLNANLIDVEASG